MNTIALYSRFETSFESARDYENPVQDVSVEVEFQCAGTRVTTNAFWDGERIWRVRFSPEMAGLWTWRVNRSPAGDGGFQDQAGSFECVQAAGTNPLYGRGPIRVSDDKRHFVHADGTPFFWLGDTAWNGPLKSSETDWTVYLSDRAQKGFTVIQFVATQWISAAGDAEGRPAYLGRERIRIEPAFFQRLDRRVDAINAFGMVAAPVLVWAAGWNPDSCHLNPRNSLSDDQLELLIRYMGARYGAHHVVWILAGDGIYEGAEAERWRRIGRTALSGSTRPATIHPGGKSWSAPEFRTELWFHFNGYQSGHWNDDDNFRWINEGPPSADWRTEPRCPHINLEPCYEGHRAMATGRVMDAGDVRRAAYWSLLASPPAGITYGAHGIWSWESTPGLPMSHPNTGIAPAWRDALHLPGSACMGRLKATFASINWPGLEPCPELVENQPGKEHPALFIAAARSAAGDLAMLYMPRGGTVRLRTQSLRPDMLVSCVDPSNGGLLWRKALAECGDVVDTSAEADRVLVVKS
jgi:hypothetical protein